MNTNFMLDPNNYDANGNLKNPMLQQMAQQAMQAQAQQTANSQSGVGVLEQYRPQDGYLSGGQFAEQAKLNGREAQLDNRELRNGEKLDRLNPFSESGYMNEKDYAKRYAPDGTLRPTGQRPEGVLDGAMDSMKGVLDGRQMPAFMYGGSGVGGQTNNVAEEQPPAQPNTHEMPDGTVMEGATHEEYEKNQASGQKQTPVLSTPEEIPNLGALGQGDFARGMMGMDDEGSLDRIIENIGDDGQSGTATNNKRTETETAQDMERKKEERKEKMMAFAEMMGRYGGNIMNAGSRGGMAMVGAMGTTTAEIADKEREIAQQKFENGQKMDEEIRRQQASQAKADADRFGSPAEIYAARELSGKLDGLMADLSNSEYNAVGATKNWLTNKIGGMMGTDEASIRLRLQELVVDKTLSNTAFTKGAISDKEMALFRSDIPQFSDSETVWLKWLNDYQAATRMLEHNLRTGYAPFKEQNARGGGSVDDLLSKYD